MEFDVLVTFLKCYAVAALYTVLFIKSGRLLLRVAVPHVAVQPLPASLLNGGGYFVGMTLYFIGFVCVSRLANSAFIGVTVSLALSVFVLAIEQLTTPSATTYRERLYFVAVFAMLVGLFTVTNATCWVDIDRPVPGLMTHSGSIHAGRYANYAIHIAQNDRVPHLAQNVGQSLLAASHLLLGVNAPLAALMTWLPFSLAAFACLLFGVLRTNGLTIAWSAVGAYFVLFCNVALSLVHVQVFDNGSPLGFAGYSDIVAGAATFLLAAVWWREVLLGTWSRWSLALAALLAVGWSWYAPQNVVVAAVAIAVTGLPRFGWRLAACGAALSVGAAFGGVQLGTFLPRSLREDVGAKVYDIGNEVRIRPYLDYIYTHWTDRRKRNVTDYRPHGGYTKLAIAADRGAVTDAPDSLQLFVRRLALFESHLWGSVRMIGFLMLGLAAMAWSRERVGQRIDFTFALAAFLTGFVVTFGLELGQHKWWLTRFLVPSAVVCLIGLVTSLAPPGKTAWRRPSLWITILVVGTAGPSVEFARTLHHHCGHRRAWVECMAAIARSTGPFLEPHPH